MEAKGIDQRHSMEPPIRFLVCDPTGNVGEMEPPGETWVFSPVLCLDAAVERELSLVAVRFGNLSLPEREHMVELCIALKHNRYSRDIPVLALLSSRHRQLLEELDQAHVDYIRYFGEDRLDEEYLQAIMGTLGPEDRPSHRLSELCPFLRYNRIGRSEELIVCGAYLDRLVLGGHRLHNICETDEYQCCEFYLNPRQKA